MIRLAETRADFEVCAEIFGEVEPEPAHVVGADEVFGEATREMAVPQVAAAPPFDEWLEQENRLGAVAVVALDGDDVVGYARLYRIPGHAHRLENGLTAVSKS